MPTPTRCLLLALALLSGFAAACGPSAPAADRNAPVAGPPAPDAGKADDGPGTWSPPFWRIETAGQPAYLLGTLADGVNETDGLTPTVLSAFRAANLVVADFDRLAPSADTAVLNQVLALRTLPPNESLRAKLPTAAFDALLARFRNRPDLGADDEKQLEFELNGTQPWAVATLLNRMLAGTTTMPTAHWLLTDAALRKVSLDYLEDALVSYRRMHDLPYDGWIASIRRALDSPKAVASEHAAVARAWKSGDLAELAAWRAARAGRAPLHDQRLVQERIAQWLTTLPSQITRGAFIIVDVEALVGPDNLRDRLTTAGYTLTRE
ncbi:MAG: TraB/GumN family protein [Planctomycetota bacterium]